MACPFCGDDRLALPIVDDLDDGCAPIHSMACACCGAHGPLCASAPAAIETWNRRWPSGQSKAWRKFYEAETTTAA